jgi:nicotinamide phosphoribosyltransferase
LFVSCFVLFFVFFSSLQVFSYFESRGGEFPKVVFFGLQYLLKNWLVGPVVTQAKIDEADELLGLHFGQPIFSRENWQYILDVHGGRLPVIIRAVPEGTVVPVKNVLFTVENTDPKCFWLTTWLEACSSSSSSSSSSQQQTQK